MIEKTTEFDKFVKGEIPIWITYDMNAYRARYIAGLGDAIDIVIPGREPSPPPTPSAFVKGGPNPNAGKLWLNYILSSEGQGLFAKGFVRPILPGLRCPRTWRTVPPGVGLRPGKGRGPGEGLEGAERGSLSLGQQSAGGELETMERRSEPGFCCCLSRRCWGCFCSGLSRSCCESLFIEGGSP